MGFYEYLRLAYFIAICVAVVINKRDLKMLALTLYAGLGILCPIMSVENPVFWYAQCFFIDVVVFVIALALNVPPASYLVAFLSVVMLAFHITGAVVGPGSSVSLYRLLIPVFESSQLLTCILLSRPLLAKFSGLEYRKL